MILPRLFPGVLRPLAILALFTTASSVPAQPSDRETVFAWLDAQTNVRTWSADLVQTRTLAALTQPLVSTGRVWFAAPNRFHWELGQPPKTIAVREAGQLLVIYPRLKRVERYPLDDAQTGPMKDTLALLDAGFPRGRADIESRFNILSLKTNQAAALLTLQPRAEAARRFMPRIIIGFDDANFSLRSTELVFADGSTMRNDFTNAVLNPQLDNALFAPVLDPAWAVTEPLSPNQPRRGE